MLESIYVAPPSVAVKEASAGKSHFLPLDDDVVGREVVNVKVRWVDMRHDL